MAHSIPALAGTVVIWTLGEMIASPTAGAYVLRIAPEHVRGRYMGMLSTTWSIALFLAPIAGTYLFQRNPNALWVASGALGVASAALMLYTPSRRET